MKIALDHNNFSIQKYGGILMIFIELQKIINKYQRKILSPII